MKPHVADVRVRTREDGEVIDGEHGHIVESHKLRVLNLHSEGQDAKAVVAEPEHGVPEHEAHDSRLHRRAGTVEMLAGAVIWMERERERRHPLHVARKWRQRRDEALEAVNDDHAVVEEIWLRDLHAADENLGGGGVRLDRIGGDGDAAARTQRFYLGPESEPPKVIDGEEAWNDVLAEKVRNGAREAGAEGGVGGSEDGGRTGPGGGSGGRGVGERRRRRSQLVETEMREDRREQCSVREERVFLEILWSWRRRCGR